MLDYKVVNAKEKDIDILTSIKLVTMIDDEMDKVLSYAEKTKIRKSIDKNIERTCELYKVIYVDNKIAGAYLVLPYDDGYMIDEIYLFEEYRNNGIGTKIIQELIKEYRTLYIWVYKNNKNAIRLVERLGFMLVSNGRTLIFKYDGVYNLIKDKLLDIKLGYRDKNGNLCSGFNESFKDNYYLQTPKSLLETKVGLCFDQVELERELVSKLDVDCRTYFINYPDDKMDYSHSFLIYKDSKKYYWIENAWLKYRGLHMYDSKDDLFDDVLGKFVDTIPNGDIKKIKMYMFDKPRAGINYSKYFTHCINGRSVKVK
jgi:GNAT superfamily N-acetyltransferase